MGDTVVVSRTNVYIPVARSTINTYTVSSIGSRASRSTMNSNSRSSWFSHEALPSTLPITGNLPGGKYLVMPLNVQVEYDEGEFLMNETQFYIHAVGATLEETYVSFLNILSDTYDVLMSEEENLDDFMSSQLQYLRSYIRPVSY